MGNLNDFNYDAGDYEPQHDFSPIPPGEYRVVIVESEMRESRSGKGRYLWLKMQVVEGEHDSRLLFDQLNIQHSNETAQRIARERLSSICHQIGVMKPRDSGELHDKPFVVNVVIKRGDDGTDRNKVKNYAAKTQHLSAGAGSTSTAGQPSVSAPPWRNRR